MPDEKGVLSQEEVDKIVAFLNGHAGGRKQDCPICGDDKWTVVNQLVQPFTLDGKWLPNFGIPGYPFVMLINMKCGYTRLVNAVIAGVIPDPDVPEKGK